MKKEQSQHESTEGKTQDLESKGSLQKQGGPVTSKNLSVSLGIKLMSLIDEVTDQNVNPQTVRAACDCANEIHKILRLNYDIKRTMQRDD